MRILYLSPCGQLGGAERCLIDALASLREAEPDWSLHLVAAEDGPLLEEARRLGVQVELLAFPKRFASTGGFGETAPGLALKAVRALPAVALYSGRLRRCLRRIQPDLIHSNGVKMHVLSACCAVAPVIWHLHDYLVPGRLITRGLRLVSSRCAGAIAVSPSVAECARWAFGPSLTVQTILNAVDTARFHPVGPRARLGPAGSRGVIRIGLIATFARWKGHETFLRALADPSLAGFPIRAFIIGGPIYRTARGQHSLAELKALAREIGVHDRVEFTGFLPDSAPAIRALDIVVHASTAPEPFGLVIPETMASGKALIASACGGAAGLFSDGVDALATEPGNPSALAHAIGALARDPEKRRELGRAARRTAEARFHRSRLGPALAAFYRRVRPRADDSDPVICEYSTSTAEISTAA